MFNAEHEVAVANVVVENNSIKLHKSKTEITADQEIFSDINSVSVASSYVGMKQP